MYKFEISADSPQELKEKMKDFANEILMDDKKDEYLDEPIPTVNTFNGVKVDSAGVPYNEKIHSANGSFNKDGTWRTRRNIDKVEAAAAPKVNIEVPAVPAPLAEATVYAPAFNSFEAPKVSAAPIENKYENVPIPAETKPIYNITNFKSNLMMIIANLVQDGKLTKEHIIDLKNHFQVKEIWDITKDENKVAGLYNTFVSLGFVTGSL